MMFSEEQDLIPKGRPQWEARTEGWSQGYGFIGYTTRIRGILRDRDEKTIEDIKLKIFLEFYIN